AVIPRLPCSCARRRGPRCTSAPADIAIRHRPARRRGGTSARPAADWILRRCLRSTSSRDCTAPAEFPYWPPPQTSAAPVRHQARRRVRRGEQRELDLHPHTSAHGRRPPPPSGLREVLHGTLAERVHQPTVVFGF